MSGSGEHAASPKGPVDGDRMQRGTLKTALSLAVVTVLLSVAPSYCSLAHQRSSGQGVASHTRGLEAAADPNRFANKILIGTHSRLLWFDVVTKKAAVLHENEGVYHGIFSGDKDPRQGRPSTIWVLSRPHNWRPVTTKETLIRLDAMSGEVISRVQVLSRFAHEAIRAGNHVYVASTDAGSVLELSLPGMQLLRELQLFENKDHVNSLLVPEPGFLWVMLHKNGPSDLALVDLTSEKIVARHENVGTMAHGIGAWQQFLVVLDSEGGRFNLVHNTTGAVEEAYKVPDQKKFLKGLAIVGDTAYFGISPHQARNKRSDDYDCELAAFDLQSRSLLWRETVPTKGLLDVIASPQLWRSSGGNLSVSFETERPLMTVETFQSAQEVEAHCSSMSKELRACKLDPRCRVRRVAAGAPHVCEVCHRVPCLPNKKEGKAGKKGLIEQPHWR